MPSLTESEIAVLQEENRRLQADNDCLVNYFDRARSLQCSLRGMVETVAERGAASSWATFGSHILQDYYLLSNMLSCSPAFNLLRDQMKDSLERQIRRACDAERDLCILTEQIKKLTKSEKSANI